MIYGIYRNPDAAAQALIRLRSEHVRVSAQCRQLVRLLFTQPDRHITAEQLQVEARQARLRVSRASIYNLLHMLTESGVLQEIRVETGKTFYDTNTTHHFHLFFEETGEIHSLPADLEALKDLPRILGGIDPQRLDVVIRVRIRPGSASERQEVAKAAGQPPQRS
jgi:Fur family transcriptional regulator, iron response regulator